MDRKLLQNSPFLSTASLKCIDGPVAEHEKLAVVYFAQQQ